MATNTKRPSHVSRAMMLYISQDVYDQLKEKASSLRPPTKPGPLAAEILRQYFEQEAKHGQSGRVNSFNA